MKKKFYYILSLSLLVFISVAILNQTGRSEIRLDRFSLISEEFGKIVSLPDFLKFQNLLTIDGTVFWTNEERKKYNLSALKSSQKLNQIAERRLKDMAQNQYFGHYSPTGRAVGDEAETLNYKFLAIGENIAMGNFKDDGDLVDAWMNSPEHRENILSQKYTQIGISVEEILFEGKNTWLAVQIFGRPLSDCPSLDFNLKTQIETEKNILEDMTSNAKLLFEEMTRDKNNGNISAYNQKVPVYNSLIGKINEKSQILKNFIAQYNNQVNLFNLCLENPA